MDYLAVTVLLVQQVTVGFRGCSRRGYRVRVSLAESRHGASESYECHSIMPVIGPPRRPAGPEPKLRQRVGPGTLMRASAEVIDNGIRSFRIRQM